MEASTDEWKGLCPFHPDKNPSFCVNKSGGVFNCFGCNEKGNVISFLMKKEGLSFIDAVKMLQEWSGLGPPSRLDFSVGDWHISEEEEKDADLKNDLWVIADVAGEKLKQNYNNEKYYDTIMNFFQMIDNNLDNPEEIKKLKNELPGILSGLGGKFNIK